MSNVERYLKCCDTATPTEFEAFLGASGLSSRRLRKLRRVYNRDMIDLKQYCAGVECAKKAEDAQILKDSPKLTNG